jgi:hypothetical protein
MEEADLLLAITAGAHGLRVGVNGVELFRDAGGDGRDVSLQMRADEWFLPAAANVLSVEVREGEGADPVRVRLASSVEQERAHVDFGWRRAGPPAGSFRLEWPFRPPAPVRSQLWREAHPFGDALPDEARAAAVLHGLDYYAAYAMRDEARLAELLAYKCADVARARGGSPDEVLASHLRAFQRTRFALEPVVPEEVRATLVCGGRAVWLTRGDAPWIECVPERYFSPLSFLACVALVDGAWVVAR